MVHVIEDKHRIILDSILPYFKFNEILDVKECIHKVHENDVLGLRNMPLKIYTDTIMEFLVQNEFATNYNGDVVVNSKGMALSKAGSLKNFERSVHSQHEFILIDDDNLSNLLCSNTIETSDANAQIEVFTNPEKALEYVLSMRQTETNTLPFILLDINMPKMSGWELVQSLQNSSTEALINLRIYMLTSSIDPKDRERAKNNPYLWGYLEKPLTHAKFKSTFIR